MRSRWAWQELTTWGENHWGNRLRKIDQNDHKTHEYDSCMECLKLELTSAKNYYTNIVSYPAWTNLGCVFFRLQRNLKAETSRYWKERGPTKQPTTGFYQLSTLRESVCWCNSKKKQQLMPVTQIQPLIYSRAIIMFDIKANAVDWFIVAVLC